MQTTNNPLEFTKALKQTRRIKFEDDKLKTEIHVCEERSCKKSYIVRYFHKINGEWVAFSTLVCFMVNEIILDFMYEYRIFS